MVCNCGKRIVAGTDTYVLDKSWLKCLMLCRTVEIVYMELWDSRGSSESKVTNTGEVSVLRMTE